MRIDIVSGQPGADIDSVVEEMKSKHCDTGHLMFMRYPERDVHHPKTLYESVKVAVLNTIADGRYDILVVTYSEHVLNAIRVAVCKHKSENTHIHQVLSDGYVNHANIDKTGRLDCWVDDIFDTHDNALMELMDMWR